MAQGRIAQLFIEKGYGFIRGADNREYFFHWHGLQNCKIQQLEADQVVTFEPTETAKGPRAEDVYI